MLGDKATGSFLGKIEVAREGQQTDAEQSVKAMLLDRGATANAKPELEIFADDVKCAHGATVGELDKNQLFYAAARGLDPASARALLLEGFVGGLWDDIDGDDQGIAELARAALQEGGGMNLADAPQLRARGARPVPGDPARLALSRQRRDRAEAAGGDRRHHPRLRP